MIKFSSKLSNIFEFPCTHTEIFTTFAENSSAITLNFNAGVLAETGDWDSTSEAFIEYVLSVCNGTQVHSEETDYREIAIFKTGVTL